MHTNIEQPPSVPALQVWHGEVPADEAHLQAYDLSVFGGGRAAVFGRPGVLTAAVAGRLWADAVPRQVGHQRWLLKQRRNLTDVLHCGGTQKRTHDQPIIHPELGQYKVV